jgi:hypothetical protein
MDKIALGISLLNGELKAAAFGKGTGAPEGVEGGGTGDDLAGLGAAVRGVVDKTGAGGKPVAVALAHPRLTDQIVEVPPVKGWKLERLLQRRAQMNKAFTGQAVWSHQAALPTKRGGAAWLHVCPKAVLEQLSAACAEAQLQLVRVLPTTAILANHLKALPLAKDEVAVLAAETGALTTVVVGRKDGRVCVGRVVRANWISEAERVGVDLTRSIGFAEQQSGLTVNSVWLFGAGASAQVGRMEALLKLPVKLSPVDYSPLYWAEQAAALPEPEDGNLISVATQQAPQRRRFLTLTTMLLCVVAAMTAAAVSVVEVTRHHELQSIALLKGKMADLRSQQRDLQQAFDELEQMRAMTRVVSGQKLPPAPAWLLGYLSQAAPEGLVLTQLRIARTNDFWAVRLAGSADLGTNPPALFRAAYQSLTNSLTTGPFHLAITRSTLARAGQAASAPAVASDQTDAAEAVDREPDTFALEGVMR